MNRRDRNSILGALRAQTVDQSPLPDLPAVSETAPAAFQQALHAAGGQLASVTHPDDAVDALAHLCQVTGATRIASLVAGLPGAREGITIVDSAGDPHHLGDIDLAIVPGRFAVVENGAVWISGLDLRQQALCFACEHLVLVVPGDQLVPDMHAAYRRRRIDDAAFGVFISGPSKTADIEQALVLGAHGPRSLTVLLLGAPPPCTLAG